MFLFKFKLRNAMNVKYQTSYELQMNYYTSYYNIMITSITIYKIIEKNPDIIVIYIILHQT